MSAIFGIYQRNHNPVDEKEWSSILGSLAHHGFNPKNIWKSGYVALGDAATFLAPESCQESLLFVDPETGIVIISDARIDNRVELVHALGIDQTVLEAAADSLLILKAYLKWGKDSPAHLIGDFVFMIWDPREQGFFGARDAIGIRWLYYFMNSRRFGFVSNMSGMLDLMDEPAVLDLQTLEWSFRGGSIYNVEHTFYKNIYKLQPGCSIWVDSTGIKTWKYWDPEKIRPLPVRDPREGAEILRTLIDRAVADRCRTRDIVGTHISGGLDSSAVAAFVANQISQKPIGFSWSPDPATHPLLELDERIYVKRVAEHLNVDIAYAYVPPSVDVLIETSDPAILPNETLRYEYAVMLEAKERGIHTIFSGWGGDEFAFVRPRNYLAGLLVQGRWKQFLKYLSYRHGWTLRSSARSIYFDALIPLLPPAMQEKMPIDFWDRTQTTEMRLVQKILDEKRRLLPSEGFFAPHFYQMLKKVHQPLRSWYRPGLHLTQIAALRPLLSRIESWAAWSAKLGVRHVYPLLDQRVVEFSLAIPEDWAVLPEGNRAMAYWAVDTVLPQSIMQGRDKRDRALQHYQKSPEHKIEVSRLRLQKFDNLCASTPPVTQWLNMDYLRAALLPHDAPQKQAVQIAGQRGLWDVLSFAFIDPRTVISQD